MLNTLYRVLMAFLATIGLAFIAYLCGYNSGLNRGYYIGEKYHNMITVKKD